MSGWFNYYKKIKWLINPDEIEEYMELIEGKHYEYVFDKDQYLNDLEYVNNVELNKGKFVNVVDDFDDRPLTESEIQWEEEKRNDPFIPILIESENGKQEERYVSVKQKPKRKYKTRVPIPPKLREEILKERSGICQRCGVPDSNQLHHINKNPSDNRKENLKLLCYDCHLNEDGKKKKKHSHNQ